MSPPFGLAARKGNLFQANSPSKHFGSDHSIVPEDDPFSVLAALYPSSRPPRRSGAASSIPAEPEIARQPRRATSTTREGASGPRTYSLTPARSACMARSSELSTARTVILNQGERWRRCSTTVSQLLASSAYSPTNKISKPSVIFDANWSDALHCRVRKPASSSHRDQTCRSSAWGPATRIFPRSILSPEVPTFLPPYGGIENLMSLSESPETAAIVQHPRGLRKHCICQLFAFEPFSPAFQHPSPCV